MKRKKIDLTTLSAFKKTFVGFFNFRLKRALFEFFFDFLKIQNQFWNHNSHIWRGEQIKGKK